MFFSFFCSATVAVGLYGNDDVHNAAVRFGSTLRAVQHNIDSVKNQVCFSIALLSLRRLSVLFMQSQSLRYNLENQSFPLADHLTEVVEGKALPNSTIQRVAIELLQGASMNITEATTDMNLLYQRVSAPSPLPSFLQVYDLVEMIR